MNWRCRLIGHKSGEYVRWVNCWPYVCERCGASEMDEDFRESWHVDAWRRFLYRAWCEYHKLLAWLGPCPECGRRFGRHDPENEHIPF
jgi:hypothetical protein